MLPSFLQNRYAGYRRLADEGIKNGRVAETTKNRDKYWMSWSNFCHPWGIDPFLDKATTPFVAKMQAITCFAGMVRCGDVGRGKQIRSDTVRAALSAIAQTIAMDRGTTPIHDDNGNYLIPIAMMLKGWKKEDPPTEQKLAVGIDLVEYLCQMGLKKQINGLLAAVGDWVLIAFYFLLRVGEYTTKNHRVETKQTVQFRLGDVVFF